MLDERLLSGEKTADYVAHIATLTALTDATAVFAAYENRQFNRVLCQLKRAITSTVTDHAAVNACVTRQLCAKRIGESADHAELQYPSLGQRGSTCKVELGQAGWKPWHQIKLLWFRGQCRQLDQRCFCPPVRFCGNDGDAGSRNIMVPLP
ncbi:hypothetical protein ElyMa_001030900 [Elysia marginata]|uniref:Uncharacterized protein n=1 Tax=Elysia marginata TaxID=1093978 RepID=A0AAV4HL49_9GAST|nr:hypothetical protein ElyMa_001030900 [Elysia marginata]